MDNVGKIYNIALSVYGIGFGVLLLFFNDWFTKANAHLFMALYEKTHFNLFKLQSEEMSKPYMRVLAIALGLVFIATGVIDLFG